MSREMTRKSHLNVYRTVSRLRGCSVLRNVIKHAASYAGFDIFRANSDDFRWSHTVEDYNPIAPKPRWHKGEAPHTQLHRRLDRNRVEYQAFLNMLQNNASLIHGIAYDRDNNDTDLPFWNNVFFSSLDAASLVTFIAWKRPAHYLEIGSGHSTRFAKYAINTLKLRTKITSIDPAPQQDIDRICDRIIRRPLESCDLGVFDELAAGDILFFDGSHRAFSNSDVVIFFFEVMPRLEPGVIVHIHDIFIPDDYPAAWKHRLYNEQYILAAMLICEKPPFRVVAPIAFIWQDEALSASAKRAFKSPTEGRDIPFVQGGSFWIEVEALDASKNGAPSTPLAPLHARSRSRDDIA